MDSTRALIRTARSSGRRRCEGGQPCPLGLRRKRKVSLRATRPEQFPEACLFRYRAITGFLSPWQPGRAARVRRGDRRQWRQPAGDVHVPRATCPFSPWMWFYRSLGGRRSTRRKEASNRIEVLLRGRAIRSIRREQFLLLADRARVAAELRSPELFRERA